MFESLLPAPRTAAHDAVAGTALSGRALIEAAAAPGGSGVALTPEVLERLARALSDVRPAELDRRGMFSTLIAFQRLRAELGTTRSPGLAELASKHPNLGHRLAELVPARPRRYSD